MDLQPKERIRLISHRCWCPHMPAGRFLPRTPEIRDNAQVDAQQESGSAEGAATSHRADGSARIALPDQPWWRTALDNHRYVLLAVVVAVGYASLGVRAMHRGDSLVGLAGLGLATAVIASLIGWLRPEHTFRRWATLTLLLLVTAPFLWLYVSR